MIFAAFLFGFVGSLHCVGMCGPIAFLLPVDRKNSYKKIAQISLYHLGRLISYASMGLLFGWLGSGFYLFGFQQQLSIAIGVLMLVAILWPRQQYFKTHLTNPLYKLISKVKSGLGMALKKKTADTFFTIGILNGLLPCGLVYMAVFAAIASGDAWQGALYMALFGLGTLPLMTMAIYLSSIISTSLRQNIQRLIPIFVGLIAILFIIRGLGLGIPYLSPAPIQEMTTAHMNCH
ncbi:sulfite exporter TauE/SafE family protein [Gaetbulibacter sp. M240]|uniref:sulfite exporter TauE/SafE family protein n=1 Tax=Gaetbulibacter sp. M240 TaxID=3126511 RepID=UPI00374ECE50